LKKPNALVAFVQRDLELIKYHKERHKQDEMNSAARTLNRLINEPNLVEAVENISYATLNYFSSLRDEPRWWQIEAAWAILNDLEIPPLE
jgi:hypothetical protein